MTKLEFAPHLQFEGPECALVVCCGCPQANDQIVDATRRILRAQIDWDLFRREAFRHRVVPLAYRHLSRLADCVPNQVLDALRSDFRFIAARNLVLSAEMIRIVEALAATGIRAVPIKGPLLSMAAFGDLSMRQFADIDVVVHSRDVLEAKAMLIKEGYVMDPVFSPAEETEYIRSEHAFRFPRGSRDTPIELHWRLNDRRLSFALDSEFWDHLSEVEFHGRRMHTLRSDDLLLYLCIHGANHFWGNVEWISCLTALLQRSSDWDWDSIVDRAVHLGGRRLLQLALLLASDLGASAAVAYPLGLMRRDSVADALVKSVWEGMFAEELHGAAREVHRYAFYLRTRERIADRLRVVQFSSARIPHPDSKDWSLFPVPKSLHFLYYAIRPIRLLVENGIEPVKSALLPR
jgi:hypothetical protein